MNQISVNDHVALAAILAIPALVGIIFGRSIGTKGGVIASALALVAEGALVNYKVVPLSTVRSLGYVAFFFLALLLWNWLHHRYRMSRIDRMHPADFEEVFCPKLLEDLGFKVIKSSGRRGGIDLIAVKDRTRYGVEVKHKDYSSNRKVTKDDTARAMEYSRLERCSKCIIITNSEFTKPARELAQRYGGKCILVDRSLIRKILSGEKLIMRP